MAELDKFLETLKSDIERAEKELVDIDNEIKKAQAVGLDVSELRERYNNQKKQVELIRKVYKV